MSILKIFFFEFCGQRSRKYKLNRCSNCILFPFILSCWTNALLTHKRTSSTSLIWIASRILHKLWVFPSEQYIIASGGENGKENSLYLFTNKGIILPKLVFLIQCNVCLCQGRQIQWVIMAIIWEAHLLLSNLSEISVQLLNTWRTVCMQRTHKNQRAQSIWTPYCRMISS